MAHALESPLAPMLRDFAALAARGEAFALATVVSTEGSTYRKAGTQILIEAGGAPLGLLSGGCLEADLAEHARAVVASGMPRLVQYDMRTEDDLLFGIGSGCEGSMRILVQRVDASRAWQPLDAMAQCIGTSTPGALAIIVEGAAAGRAWWPGGGDAPWREPDSVRDAREATARDATVRRVAFASQGIGSEAVVIPLQPPPRLVLCGAGPDARPIARHAVALGFSVTVCDHRPALLDSTRFPDCSLSCLPATEFGQLAKLESFAAAVVMSHHLEADLAYLQALAEQPAVGYVGLLGPAPRRDRLLAALGERAIRLAGRLRAPVGLDIGARTPEAIALAVAAELHAWLAGRTGGIFHAGSPTALP